MLAGIGVSALRLSDVTRAEIGNSQEVAIELFYAHAITDYLTLKPTLNYIIDPSAYPSLDNVSIFTLRSEIQF